MERTNPSVTIGKAVDHDVETGVDAALRGAGIVLIRWVGDVQGEMVIAVWITIIDRVNAFRRFPVAFLLLRADWIAAQGDAISLETFSVTKDRQFPVGFF